MLHILKSRYPALSISLVPARVRVCASSFSASPCTTALLCLSFISVYYHSRTERSAKVPLFLPASRRNNTVRHAGSGR